MAHEPSLTQSVNRLIGHAKLFRNLMDGHLFTFFSAPVALLAGSPVTSPQVASHAVGLVSVGLDHDFIMYGQDGDRAGGLLAPLPQQS
jgi:hypothetical protein